MKQLVPRRAAAVCVLLLPVFACAEEAPPDDRSGAQVRDSAGITIVESSEAAWDVETAWRLDPEPRLQIGDGTSGSPERQFSHIAEVHRLSGGQLAVLDPWVPALSFFDASGEFLGRFDRSGEGPGEFPRMTRLESFTCGSDTVYVVGRQTVSAYVPPGTFARSFRFDPPTRVQGCAAGMIVGARPYGARATAPGMRTDSSTLEWYDRTGTPVAVIDTVPNRETTWSDVNGPLGSMPTVFGRSMSVSPSTHGIATGWPDRLQIEIRDHSGSVERSYRAVATDQRATSAEVERFRDFVMNPWRGNAGEQREMEERLDAAAGRRLPAFAELLWSTDGHLWARRYDHLDAIGFFDRSALARTSPPEFPEPRAWEVFDPDGVYLGLFETPPRFTVHEIGPDWIMGVWRDDLDIPYVRIYSIVGS